VILPAWVVHRDRRWFEDPEGIPPERWGGDLARHLPRFAYFPFGGRAPPVHWQTPSR
jgi:cytochrome P450